MYITYNYSGEIVEQITDYLWETDVSPFWKPSKWKTVVLAAAAILVILLGVPLVLHYSAYISSGTAVPYFFLDSLFAVLMSLGIVAFLASLFRKEEYEKGKWSRKIETRMNRIQLSLYITEKHLGVLQSGHEAVWEWSDVKWYSIGRAVIGICVRGTSIFIWPEGMEAKDREELLLFLQKNVKEIKVKRNNAKEYLKILKKLQKVGVE